jgi:hypothetical protein
LLTTTLLIINFKVVDKLRQIYLPERVKSAGAAWNVKSRGRRRSIFAANQTNLRTVNMNTPVVAPEAEQPIGHIAAACLPAHDDHAEAFGVEGRVA